MGDFVGVSLEVTFGSGGFEGGATRSCHRFLPIAHTSSHELAPTLRPWVLHTHAMSQARSVTPSTKCEYATASSFANTGSFLSKYNGRGRGSGRRSLALDVEGLLLDEGDGVDPGKGTSRDR